jgi:predicted esterase
MRLGSYEILQPIGAGGMGEVYRARHLKLGREVAIKVLPAALGADPALRARFEREARTASALNHPNIVTIYDIIEQEGVTCIAMELVQGRTLRELIAEGPVALQDAVRWAIQVAEGLVAAHEAGIVHRDLKPANVMVTSDGRVKILDFGLAKPLAASGTDTAATETGIVLGTPHYMSPEQCSGGAVDHRSDQFAFGDLLYEMIARRPAFDGPSAGAIFSAVLLNRPPPLRALRADAPPALERVVGRCLEKDPDRRFPSMATVAAELRGLHDGRAGWARGRAGVLAAAALALAVGGAGWIWWRGAERRWARGEALEEIVRFTERGALFDAYRTALRAERYLPGDPTLERLVNRITLPIPVKTDPPGAEVWVTSYSPPGAEWIRLGTTPMSQRIPYAMMRWRISKTGYEPFEGAPFSSGALGALAQGLRLEPAGSIPAGTVRIPGGIMTSLPGAILPQETPVIQVPEFLLDRYEVTNRRFHAFVAAGGYAQERWWQVPMRRDGKTIPRTEAMGLFVDATGRPGPATWEAGGFRPGEDELPVSGISWYEAAAYCAFAGGSLPTVWHWRHAVGQEQLSDILLHSNIDRQAKAPVGQFKGLAAYGTYDMAGNVKEWTWNAAGEARYILGGAYNEPGYLFTHLVAQDPLGREPANGVRCARYSQPQPARLLEPIPPPHEYSASSPLTSEEFALLGRVLFAYPPTPLDARTERTNDSLPGYRRETVSLRTAYRGERMEAHLLLPRDAAPPYQAVIWFPGSDAYLLRSSESFASTYLFDFLPRGGRVLVYPVYDGMYERFDPVEESPGALRDRMIHWVQDLSRTIDYLETRPDIDARRIAFYGFSLGATDGPFFTAVEPRFAASILLGGGLIPERFRPEVDPARFAPHVRTPTLMINGRDDFILPYELSQRALFELLGPPADRKRHAVLEGGHIPRDRLEIVREVLDWLDRHLGAVQSGQAN